jgi:hypothetical protein
MTRALLLALALMCENVNAAPQVQMAEAADYSVRAPIPAGAAPFTLAHPLCQTGFTMAQRIDTRDRFDWIVKRQWTVTGCANGRIVYGRKVGARSVTG